MRESDRPTGCTAHGRLDTPRSIAHCFSAVNARMQHFKYRKDVTHNDLPFIESAYFACVTAQRALADTFPRVMGVDCLRRDETRFSSVRYNGNGHDQHAWKAIRERLERYEVVLVGDRSIQPLAPVCRWKAQDGHPQGGAFEVTTRDVIRASSLDWLLRDVVASSARNSAATAITTPADLPSAKRRSEAPAAVKQRFRRDAQRRILRAIRPAHDLG